MKHFLEGYAAFHTYNVFKGLKCVFLGWIYTNFIDYLLNFIKIALLLVFQPIL